MTTIHPSVVATALLGAVALSASANTGGLAFTNVTDQAGLGGFVQTLDRSLVLVGPPMVSGGAVADFNNDGLQDIYVLVGGHLPDKLFINNGDGTFTDRAQQWGVARRHAGGGAAAGDYNNDGFVDLYVTSYGEVNNGVPTSQPGVNMLYRNNGDGTFTDVAQQAGVNLTSAAFPDGFGCTFGDYNVDGHLDLLVLGWLPDSRCSRLFRNNGDGTFTDVTLPTLEDGDNIQRGFSPAIVDMDGDTYPDILMACDFGNSRYFANNTNTRFSNLTQEAGVGLDGNGMGQCVGDFNGDGLLDWYVTSIYRDNGEILQIPGTGNMLYINQGDHSYRETATAAGVSDGGWGWGARAIDIDHDTDLDILETNGWPFPASGETGGYAEWIDEQSYLFLNNGDATNFTEVALQTGFVHTAQGRGMSRFDMDNDGDQDVLIFANGSGLTLFRNDLSGPGTNWLRVFLDNDGAEGIAPGGLGSFVRATIDGKTQTHPLIADASYLATSEHSVHMGLGDATTIDELVVTWPNGRLTRLQNVTANQTLTLTPTCDGDADGDSDVNFDDLLHVLFRFGATTADADTDGSGLADFDDLLFTLFRFGPCQ